MTECAARKRAAVTGIPRAVRRMVTPENAERVRDSSLERIMQKQNKSGKNVVAFAALAAAVAGVGIASDSQAAVLGTYRFMGSDPSGDLDAPTQTGLTYGTWAR